MEVNAYPVGVDTTMIQAPASNVLLLLLIVSDVIVHLYVGYVIMAISPHQLPPSVHPVLPSSQGVRIA